MDIFFKNKKLARSFNEGAQLEKIHGTKRAKKIRIRLAELRAAASLMDFWPPKNGPSRCHELTRATERTTFGGFGSSLSIDLCP